MREAVRPMTVCIMLPVTARDIEDAAQKGARFLDPETRDWVFATAKVRVIERPLPEVPLPGIGVRVTSETIEHRAHPLRGGIVNRMLRVLRVRREGE